MKDNYNITELNKLLDVKTSNKKNSHKKGGDFVRKICNILNKKFNTKEFSKTPGSGAYATSHNLPSHLQIYGDIITPKNFRFCIECKKGYNDITFYDFLNEKSQFLNFINQSRIDAKKCDKKSLILFKQDYKPILAISHTEVIADLIQKNMHELPKIIILSPYVILYFDELLITKNDLWFN